MRFIARRSTVSWFWAIASLVLFCLALYGLVSGVAIFLPGRFSDGGIVYRADDPAEFRLVIAGNLALALGFALLAFFHSPYLIGKFAEGRGRKPTQNFLIVILMLGSLLAALIVFGLYKAS